MFNMKGLKEFEISFIGLRLGKHQFSYQIDNRFFEFFDFQDFEKSDIKVDLNFEKKNNMFNLEFVSNGVVTVLCDVSAEPFELKVGGKLKLIVKFGDEYNDDNDEILIIPHNSYQLDVSQFMYEMIALSLPVKKVHPGIEDGTLESEVVERLREFENDKDKEKIDPRWAKLKELKTNKTNKNGTS